MAGTTPRPSFFGRTKRNLALGLLGGALAGKVWLFNKYRSLTHKKEAAESPAWHNRRSFGALPRRKQREIIYGKRAQLRDFESITYRGYAPLGTRRRRRSLASLFRS